MKEREELRTELLNAMKESIVEINELEELEEMVTPVCGCGCSSGGNC